MMSLDFHIKFFHSFIDTLYILIFHVDIYILMFY